MARQAELKLIERRSCDCNIKRARVLTEVSYGDTRRRSFERRRRVAVIATAAAARCAAVLGQCGPRVSPLKSLFPSLRYLDEVSCLREDRQAELQSIWQEIGEDKWQKLEELSQMVSTAVDEIYERAREESMRRKLELEEMVAKSEIRLKELLGSSALQQVIAPRELPLQARLNMNMTHLKDLDNARVDGYGWVRGHVLVKLRHQVSALREMLKLPPCDSADLDEVLASTTEALQNLCPVKVALIQPFSLSKSEQKPIFEQILIKDTKTVCEQRLHCFYQTLCTMENVWMDSFATKDVEKAVKFSEAPARSRLRVLGEMVARKRNFDTLFGEKNGLSSTTSTPFLRCTTKRSSSKQGHRSTESRRAKPYSNEAYTLEHLSHKIFKKLEDINKQMKCAAQLTADISSPLSLCSPMGMNSPSLRMTGTSASISPSLEDNAADTPTTVLPELSVKTSTPSYHCIGVVSPSLWQGTAALGCQKKMSPTLCTRQDQSESLDTCWAAPCANDLNTCEFKEEDSLMNQSLVVNVDVNRPSDLFSSCSKHDTFVKEPQSISFPPTRRWPLITITNKTAPLSPLATEKTPPPLSDPPPPPPPPLLLPPPPPPPPPPRPGVKTKQPSKSAKLKRSANISKLYMGMKKKVEGAASIHSTSADVAVQRRTMVGAGTREGMAEALAEITKRSAYFRKIEDDVQKHANSILEVKSRLEAFETNDMHKLLKFHESMEARLEQLTDESQVLARFEGFPVKKLETVRAAASLYRRLTSLVQQIDNWAVEPPMPEQLDKVTAFFDKVKTDVEAIERTKDEDFQRFNCQKVHFSYEIMSSIKEAVVGLSSRCLASALKDSQRTKASMMIDDEYICTKDMNKLRTSFQMLYKAFQLAFRVHNFAGGHDDRAEQLSSDLALEMEAYPSSFWLELVNK